MTRRRLPIGIQTFRKVRDDGCYYVDKTAFMHRLAAEGSHYFLSRPRRFGKSLFLDTLKELFEGNEALFEGLDVHDRWDWSRAPSAWCGSTSVPATSTSRATWKPTSWSSSPASNGAQGWLASTAPRPDASRACSKPFTARRGSASWC